MSDKDKKKKKKKLLEQQEDYASAASGERSFFGKFSPTAFITRGISNLIADDEDDNEVTDGEVIEGESEQIFQSSGGRG